MRDRTTELWQEEKDLWHVVEGDFRHCKNLFTTPEAWEAVREACAAAGVPESQLAAVDLTPTFGLIRGSLDLPDDFDLRTISAGHNHILGFGTPGRSIDDPEGTPKVWSTGQQEPADVALPPRQPDGPGTGITVGVVDTGYSRHPWVRGACTYSPDDLEIKSASAGLDQLDRQITGHGLFVAGLVLEQAPGATVRMERVVALDGHAEAIDV